MGLDPEQAGCAAQRQLLGKMAKGRPPATVLATLRACQDALPLDDPEAWLWGTLRKPAASKPDALPAKLSLAQIKADPGLLRGYRDTGLAATSLAPDSPSAVCAGRKEHDNRTWVDAAIGLVVTAMDEQQSWKADWQPLIDWLNEGVQMQTIMDAVAATVKRRAQSEKILPPVQSLAYFTRAVRDLHRQKRRAA